MTTNTLFYTPQHTLNISTIIKEKLKKYEDTKRIRVPRQSGLSQRTKELLFLVVKAHKQNYLEQSLVKKLNNQFFDDIFDFYHTLSDIESNATLFLIQKINKRRFKDDITSLALNDNTVYNQTIKLLDLTDKTGISNDIKCNKTELKEAYKGLESSISHFNRYNLTLFEYIKRFSIGNSLSNLSIRLFYSIVMKFSETQFILTDNKKLIKLLENYFNINQQFEFCKHYLYVIETKHIKIEVLKFIEKIQNLLSKEQNEELEKQLYIHYSKSININQKSITLKLGYLLRERLILHAFANDTRSNFWKSYAKKCTDAIIFVTSPTPIVFMPFGDIGVIEFIDVGNATFIFDKTTFNTILARVVNISSHNDIFNINLSYRYSEYRIKEIIKKEYSHITKIDHRGHTSTWQGKFKRILQRDYHINYL